MIARGPVVALVVVVATLAACSSPSGSPAASGSPGVAVPILIDTDVAPDDIAAISFLVASPNVEIKAITVSGTGEAHCDGGVDTVLRLLERLQAPDIPVACGRETPIEGDHAFPDEWRAAADSGSGLNLPDTSRQPTNGTAVDLIADSAANATPLRILTLGPLTNLADALTAHPELADQIESVYVMGGAVHVPGNVAFGGPADNQVAEWNVYVDPTALQQVIDAGLAPLLVSLDGTNQVPVTTEFAQQVQDEAIGEGAKVLAELFATHPFMTDGTYYLWDPLAAEIAAGYPVGEFSEARVEVEQAEGAESGFTRPVDGEPNAWYLSTAEQATAEDTLLDVLNKPANP
jgi:inosine-uridine nucleoside N-ribohydrolase